MLLGGMLSWPLLACDPQLSFGRLVEDASPSDAGVPDARTRTLDCTQRGPLLVHNDSTQAACGDGARGFHHALCSCSELALSGPTVVDGFDSLHEAYTEGQTSGALAANGALFARALRTGGSLWVAGEQGIPLSADLTVSGNLFDQGQLSGAHDVSVAGRARIAGDVRLERLQLTGSLTLRAGAALEVSQGAPLAVREAVTVAPPCRCDTPLDLSVLLDEARLHNDNDAVGLAADDGLKLFSAPRTLTLPCGRYYVSAINAQRALTLRVAGRVALFVRDGIVVDSAASLTVELADDAELDLFVGHGIAAAGPVQVGARAAPTRTRLYFGGPDTLFFAGETMLAASLVAPGADLVSSGPLELFGAALVRHVATDQALTLHYDRALADRSCSAASCANDADCAPLLRCDHGTCLP
jgi:hypothetical protein